MKRFFYISLSLVVLASACQPDTRNNRYDSWDANQNSGIDDQEFEQAFTTSPYYDDWNQDDNREVSQEEFSQGFFNVIDKNDDGLLSNEEWQQGKEAYFSDVAVDDTEELSWDQNGDQQVQPEEFQSALNELDYYRQWDEDSDGKLSEPEVAQGVFAMWDTDGNGVIEANEYEVWDNEP